MPNEETQPDFIPCTQPQAEMIAAYLERFQSTQLQMQGTIYRAAFSLGIDLGNYEFNAQRLGFVKKP